MKKTILLSFFVAQVLSVFSQNPRLIVYDFDKGICYSEGNQASRTIAKPFGKSTMIGLNREVRLRVDNVNPFLYRISVNKTEITSNYESFNPIFSTFFPDFGKLLSELPAVTGGTIEQPSFGVGLGKIENDSLIKYNKDSYKEFNKNGSFDLIEIFQIKSDCPQSTYFVTNLVKYLSLQKNLKDLSEDFSHFTKNNINPVYDGLQDRIRRVSRVRDLNQKMLLVAEQGVSSSISTILSSFYGTGSGEWTASRLLDSLTVSYYKVDSLYETFDTLYHRSELKWKKIQSQAEEKKNIEHKLDSLFSIMKRNAACNGYSYVPFQFEVAKDNPLKPIQEKMQSAKQKLNDTVYSNLTRSIVKIFEDANSSNFSFLTGPYFPSRDGLIYHVKIEPRPDAVFVTPRRNEDFEIPLWVRWKLNWNLSTGFAYSGLHDDNYSLIKFIDTSRSLYNLDGIDSFVVKPDTFYHIKKNQENKGTFGPALMLHFYPRMGYLINPALTIGAMFNFDKPLSVQYLVGGSLIIGNSVRLILDAGLSLGNRLEFNPAYNTTDKYPAATLSDVPYIKKFDNNWFAGVTLTFTFQAIRQAFGGSEQNGAPSQEVTQDNSEPDSSSNPPASTPDKPKQ